MAESHQPHAVGLVLDAREELVDVRRRADAVEHVEHGLVRAAVRRTPERGHARGDRRVRIGARAPRQAHRRGARVLLMIGVQNEQEIHRLGGHRIDRIRLARHREEHVEHVRAVAQIVARIDERLAERVLVGGGGDRRQFRDDAMREYLAVARIVDVRRVVIERGHRGDHGRDHRHRVRVVVKTLEEAQELLIDHGVARDRGVEGVQLGLVGRPPLINRYATSRKQDFSASCSTG